MELQKQIVALLQIIQDHIVRLDDLECEIEDINDYLDDQDIKIRNLRNEG